MDIQSPGLWLMPTHGRAATFLPRFFAAAAKTGISTPGWLVVDAAEWSDDAARAAYEALVLPEGWRIEVVPGGTCAKATQDAYARLGPTLQWVGWLGDDLIPETKGWDARVIAELNGWNFVSTDDGAHAPKKANGATCWSGDLLRAIGYFFPDGLQHYYVDDVMEEIGRMTGCWTVLMDVMVRHGHATFSGGGDETVARTNRFWAEDERAFARWKENDLLPAAERVLSLMEVKGVKMLRPDLKDVRLMIATPCGDGRYEATYRRSLEETQRALTQFGAKVHFIELSYCSDVALARNKLFGTFVRSEATHLLFIDSDQDWRPMDVVQLILAKKDFAAAAVVRKTIPISFAVNVSDDFGRAKGVMLDPAGGPTEVTHVGMAFALLSRAVATRMSQSYVDLAFDNTDGRTDFGVFNPMILNRQYRGEDFAFCQRWRDIGGRIFVLPFISVGHTGSFRWEGAWGESLMQKHLEESARAA